MCTGGSARPVVDARPFAVPLWPDSSSTLSATRARPRSVTRIDFKNL